MDDPALYRRYNSVQRRDAKEVLAEFAPLLKWRSDGKDSLLDIGCGTGDVTVDFILPLMPLKYSRLVAADISDRMLSYARERFQQSRITLQKLDIGRPVDLSSFTEPFDHITSFYCLHWADNQKLVMENIYKLLNVNGDCLLTFLGDHLMFESLRRMAATKKWSAYMMDDDGNQYESPYFCSRNPIVDFGNILPEVGFRKYNVIVQDRFYNFDSNDILKGSMQAILTFMGRMSMELQDQYLDELVSVTDIVHDELNIDRTHFKYPIPYKLVVIHAQK